MRVMLITLCVVSLHASDAFDAPDELLSPIGAVSIHALKFGPISANTDAIKASVSNTFRAGGVQVRDEGTIYMLVCDIESFEDRDRPGVWYYMYTITLRQIIKDGTVALINRSTFGYRGSATLDSSREWFDGQAAIIVDAIASAKDSQP